MHDVYPTARVRVLVNVDSLRIGMEGEVELTPRIQSLLASGYLRLVGHVMRPVAPPLAPVPEPLAVADPAAPPAPTKAPRKKKAVADDASSEGGS